MKVLVAGASGFLGRHVVAGLRAHGNDVIALGRSSPPPSDGVTAVRCDLTREDVPLDRLDGCDAVVNLVGIKRETGAQTFEAVHVHGTRRPLEAARAVSARHFIHVSVVCSRPGRSRRSTAARSGVPGRRSALVVRTRSAVPALACHLLWDLAVLFVAPYGG